MKTRVCVTMCVVAWCASAGAQTVLTEADVLARLTSDTARLRALRAPASVASAEVLSARRWPNPRLSVGREGVAGVSEVLTMVFQPLPTSGRRRLDVSALSELATAAALQADDGARAIRADVRHTFTTLAYAQARERAIADAQGRLQEVLRRLVAREAAGDAAGFDRLRVEREIAELDTDRGSARADRALARATMASLLAPIDPDTLTVADAARSAAPLPEVSALIAHAERTRSDLLALGHEHTSAVFSLQSAERLRRPEPEVFGGTKSSTGATRGRGAAVGVQLVLPLLDRGHADRAIADARAQQATTRLDAAKAILRAEITGLRTAALERRRVADDYRVSAATRADEIVRIAEVSYDAGERGILEVVDAHRTALSTRLHQLTLDGAVREAEIELERASAWELRP